MKKVVMLLLTAFVLTSCISITETHSDKPVKEEKRQIPAFERIRLLGSPTVYYTQADSVSLRVEAPEDLLELVETEVHDGVLTVQLRDGAQDIIRLKRLISGDDVSIFVTSPDLIDVQLVGSGDFKCDSHLDTDNLNVELRGSGDMDFRDIICDQLKVTLVGSGDMDIKHVVAIRSDMELVGSGDLEISQQDVAETHIMLKGSGDIKAGFSRCGNVVSELRGSGDINLRGHVRSLQKSVYGSGDLHAEQLVVEK